MIAQRRYDQVKVGDYVRADDWPTFHEVIAIDQRIGLVSIDIAVGGLVERLRPRPTHELIETEPRP